MNAHFNVYACKSCDAWEQTYPGNKELGECKRLPIILPTEGVIALIPASDFRKIPDPSRDIQTLRTSADFGCVSYLPVSMLG